MPVRNTFNHVCYKHVTDNSVSIRILFILFLFFIDRMKYE